MEESALDLIDLLERRIEILWQIELHRNDPNALSLLHDEAVKIQQQIDDLRK